MSDSSATFRFRGQVWVALWMCVVTGIAGLLGIVLLKHEKTTAGSVFLVTLIPFFLLVGTMLLRGRSDVVMDETGIARKLFGKTWKSIEWANIRLVTRFSVTDMYGHTITGMNIFPMARPRWRLTPSGKISFTETMDNLVEFREIFGHYLARHNIRVTVRDPPI